MHRICDCENCMSYIRVAFCLKYTLYMSLYHQYCAHRTTLTAIQYPELDADSRQILWSNMLAGEGDNISRRDIEELSRVPVNGKLFYSQVESH